MSIPILPLPYEGFPPSSRMRPFCWRSCLACCLLGLAILGLACPASAEDLTGAFETGIRAYRAGDYAAALLRFREALETDPADETLRFNLALTLYQLGDYVAARENFEHLRNSAALGAAAEYHLGLVAARQERVALAAEHLQRARAMTDSSQMQGLVDLALQSLEHATHPRRGAFAVAGGVGFDSNRTQSSEDEREDRVDSESTFGQLSASVAYPLATANDVQLGGSLYLRDDAADARYDQQALQLSLRQRWPWSGWQLAVTGESATVLLDDALFQHALGASLEAQRPLGEGSVVLRYRPRRIYGGSKYDYVEGWSQRAEAFYMRNSHGTEVRLSGEIDLDDRRDLQQGEEFFSQSPLRLGLGATLGRNLSQRLLLEGSTHYRYSRYRDDNRYVSGPHLIERRRIDRQLLLGATARLALDSGWSLRLDYRYTHNPSTVERYDYNRHLALLGLEWTPGP